MWWSIWSFISMSVCMSVCTYVNMYVYYYFNVKNCDDLFERNKVLEWCFVDIRLHLKCHGFCVIQQSNTVEYWGLNIIF